MEKILIAELEKLLNGGGAHVGLNDVTKDIPFEMLGARPHGLPYSIWQLVEHIRIAQWDMIEFSKNGLHESPKWPDGYWPSDAAPETEAQWNDSLSSIQNDLTRFIGLINTSDLFEPIAHGSGQNILREALQVADHNAYHLAEIVVLRRLLGIWKS
jgi:hypothetical protein